MSSTGGVSGNSLEDVSCPSSPVMSDSSEISPSRHSTSISSLPDLPSSIGRSRSVASNSSDHILTTLDRPRTQSFAGTPIRQAWLQVCCYERDAQTGNFLIDKHKVQIDGKFLHPELNNDPELYRISLTGLVNEERLPKTEKMLPEIGDGVIISRDRATGDVTLTKLCRKDVYLMNDNFLALKEDEKCKGKHEKLEQNTTYTIFNKQKFVEDVRNSAIDLTKIHTIGQVAISFIKINGNSVKGVPCWIKVQCLEAMNLLKSLLAGSTSEEREWLRKPSLDCSQSPRRASKARLSFGKSLSKGSLKDSKSSVNSSDSGNTPIPRTKSKSQMFRNKKKSQVSNGASPEPRSNRNSGVSQHLEPFTLNYDCLDATEEAPPSRALRDNELFRSRRISSPPNHLTSADVSLPLRRDSPSLPNTWWSACCVVLFQYIRCYFVECGLFNLTGTLRSRILLKVQLSGFCIRDLSLKKIKIWSFFKSFKNSLAINRTDIAKMLWCLSFWVDVKTFFYFWYLSKTFIYSVLCLFVAKLSKFNFTA